MARKRYTAEEIIGPSANRGDRSRQKERSARGLSETRDHRAELRDELLNGELFYTLHEARVIVEE
jgi:hypothetical protein